MANIITPVSIDVRTQKPLEPKRGPVQNKSQLISADTWSYDKSGENYTFYVYPGMIIPVISSQEIYMLIDPTKILEKDYSGWAPISGGGGSSIYDGGTATSVYLSEQVMNAGNANSEIN